MNFLTEMNSIAAIIRDFIIVKYHICIHMSSAYSKFPIMIELVITDKAPGHFPADKHSENIIIVAIVPFNN